MPSRRKIPNRTRQQLAQEADFRCSYCRSPEWIGIPMVVEHIIPLVSGGSHKVENWCFACYRCNEFKGAKTQAVDPLTNQTTALFHPKEQVWSEHFAWSEDKLSIVGLTICGRTTIEALRLNNEWIRRARRLWILSGWHPPLE